MALQSTKAAILAPIAISLVSLPRRLFSATSVKAKGFKKWYQDFWTPKPINVPPYGHFTQLGDPVLRTAASPVPVDFIQSKEMDLIVGQMVKVMRKFNCVGVAAPQIGVALRVIVMEFNQKAIEKYTKSVRDARQMTSLPLTVVINPVLEITDYTTYKHLEGCMSVRGYAAEVERYKAVALTGHDATGNDLNMALSGWNARIAQHEMDHLDGKLYVDRMDTSTFHCTCWEVVNSKAGRVEIPFYK